jgi:hypothetical protein
MKRKLFSGAAIGIAAALFFAAPLFSSERSDAEASSVDCIDFLAFKFFS